MDFKIDKKALSVGAVDELFKDFDITKISFEEIMDYMENYIIASIVSMKPQKGVWGVEMVEGRCKNVSIFDEYLQTFVPIKQMVVKPVRDNTEYMFSFSPFEAFGLECGGRREMTESDAEILTKKITSWFASKFGEKYVKALNYYNYVKEKEDNRELDN